MRISIKLLSVILSLVSFAAHAQEDYFYTNKTYHIGSELEDGGQAKNAMVCQVRTGFGGIKEYSPYEVSEYGFKNGRVYQARDILENDTLKRVFLERLVKGKMTLFFYRGVNYRKFYVEKDSGQLIALSESPEKNKEIHYREKLNELTIDCYVVNGSINLILYKQKALASFVEAYNKCEPREFPYTKYGLSFGYINTTLLIPPGVAYDFLKGSSIQPDGSMTASLFLENPLGSKGLSLHYECQYARNNFDYYRYDINQIYMVINTSSINIPVMLRYTLPVKSLKIRPFINVGGQIAFTMKNECNVMEDVMDGEVIIAENFYSPDLLAKQYAGYTAGAGFQFHIRNRINLYAELRYAMSYAVAQPTMLDRRDWFLMTGINF
jgi:hypothetical protein